MRIKILQSVFDWMEQSSKPLPEFNGGAAFIQNHMFVRSRLTVASLAEMISNITIREARKDDHEFILSLTRRLAECELPSWRTQEEVIAGTSRWIANSLESASATACFLVAEGPDNNLLGFIFVHEQLDFFTGEAAGHISDIVVSRQAEGSGAGSLLMEAAEDWSRNRGYRRVSLNVFAGNERARRLYERLGYAQETVKYVKTLEDMAATEGSI